MLRMKIWIGSMKTRYILMLAAMAFLASCAKEVNAPEETAEPVKEEAPAVKTYITVGLDPETKTSLSDPTDGKRKVYWSNGDKIKVNNCDSEELTGLGSNATSATFTITGSPTSPFRVLYPQKDWVDETHVNLPAVQTYKNGTIADNMFPMAGYSTAANVEDLNDLTLHHLCSIVKISVKRETAEKAAARSGEVDTDNITAVRFKGRADEKVSGNFEINYATPALTPATGTGTDLEVRVAKSLATSTSTAVVYYLTVPAREYANGFDIIVQDSKGDIMTKTKTAGVTLEAGKLYNMPEFEFVPTGIETGIEISSAEELIEFATAYNNNEYEALGSQLLVTVKGPISFDSTLSASFNATGGIGKDNNGKGGTNYFNGVFNGNGQTISGLEATVPVFAYTGGGGTVKNLTLSSTYSFTVGTDSGQNHGVLVGRNKGVVKDCTSNANVVINNIQDMNSAAQYYGGLVGYNPGGTVDGCTVTGNITCSQTGQTITANTASIGGIVGYQSSDGGTINNCTFKGNITISDGETYGGITANSRNFYVGGILGYGNKAIITDCTAGISGTPRSIDVRGSLAPAISGIAGWVANAESSEISGCYNYMSLSFASNGARGVTTPCRIGGIAARTAAPVSDCQNYGAISSSCNSTTIHLGGIVAESIGANVSLCTNNVGGTVTRSNADLSDDQANRYINISGILSYVSGSAADIADCTNYAVLTNNVPGLSTSTTIDMGGILGRADQKVGISGCDNEGTVTNNIGTTAVVFTRMTQAGILGYGPIAGTTISSCNNKAQVYCNAQTNKANRVSYSGGIAGLMGTFSAGVDGLEIDNCTNSARVWNRNYNSTVTPASSTPFCGGIVGAIIGTDGSKANIHDCSTSGNDVVELRGYAGGIAGYAQASTISDNTVAQALTGSNANSQGVGGIVGWAVSSSLTGCSTSSGINQVKNIGGLVAKLDTGSSIEGCNVNGVTLTNGTNAAATVAAVLVSEAASGVTITNCGVKGTLNSAAITLESNMITTNSGATVTGTYLIQ